MNGTQFNRVLGLLGFMGLCAYLGHLISIPGSNLTIGTAMTILAAAGSPLGIYIGVKGKNKKE